MISSSCFSRNVCTTSRIEPGPIAPTVIHRSSSSKVKSRCVIAYGSSKTRIAVSKRTWCLRRFCRFFCSSHSNRIAGRDQDRIQSSFYNINTFVFTFKGPATRNRAMAQTQRMIQFWRVNNKIRVVTRRSCGFRTYEAMEIALYHTLGRLPEPPWTHRFR